MSAASVRIVPGRIARTAAALVVVLAGAGAGARPAAAGVDFWTPLGPDGGRIDALAVSPAQAGLLWAGSDGAGVYRSLDGGATWVRTSRGLPDTAVSALFADPQAPGTVWVVGITQLSVSTDLGASWTALPAPKAANAVLTLAIDPLSPATLYEGAQPGIYKSTDRGASWTALPVPPSASVTTIAIDPGATSTLYAYDAIHRHLLRSTDGGAGWSESDQGVPLGNADLSTTVLIAVDPRTRPGTVYTAFTVNGTPATYRSADAGATWQRVQPGGYPLAVGQGVVYAGNLRSTDGGNSWTTSAAAPGQPLVLAAPPDSPTAVYAGTERRGLWASQDSATTWRPASSGINATVIEAMAVDPVHPRILYASVFDGVAGPGLLKSGSSGAQWHLTGPAWLADYTAVLAIDPLTSTTLYGGSAQGVAKSTDGGITWTVLAGKGHGACVGVQQLGIDPSHTDDLYVTASPGSLSGCLDTCPAFKSGDGGATWSCLNLGAASIAQLFVGPGVLYAFATYTSPHGRGQGSLYRSSDRGATWKQLSTPGGSNPAAFVTLAIDPADANRVLMSEQEGAYLSTDGGATWTEADGRLPVKGEFPNRPAALLAIDPKTPANMVAGGTFGVYRTTNSGKSWSPIVGGLPQFALFAINGNPGALILDPQRPAAVYAGTLGTGIYTYTVQ